MAAGAGGLFRPWVASYDTKNQLRLTPDDLVVHKVLAGFQRLRYLAGAMQNLVASSLSVSDLRARGQLTLARTTLLMLGAIFTSDRNGAISFSGKISEAGWLLVDEAAAQDEALERLAAQADRDEANVLAGAREEGYVGYSDFR